MGAFVYTMVPHQTPPILLLQGSLKQLSNLLYRHNISHRYNNTPLSGTGINPLPPSYMIVQRGEAY